ncbi:MAG: hypothetical protein MZV63_15505 [Marinilabiliales bacterium]|nr:hypothetical protein [Marinilabiliales bacterium]
MHGLFSTDPNKSETVKRWAFDKYGEWEVSYATAKDPATKTFAWGKVEYYKYLNDLFQRYTPYEAQKIRDQQEMVKWNKGINDDINQYEYNMEKNMRKMVRQ